MKNNPKSSEELLLPRSRALAPPSSLPRRNGQMRRRGAPVRPEGGERWRSVLVSGALPLQRTDVVGSGPYRWPPGWRSASLSLADPQGLHRKTQSCRGPCLRVAAVSQKEAKKGQGRFRGSPLPPGVTRLLLSVRTNVVLSGRFQVTELRLPLHWCGDLGVLGGQDSPLEKLRHNKTPEKRWF